MGGYTGMDPWPTLSAFETAVAQDKIHYVLVGSAFASFGFGGGHLKISPEMIHYFVKLIQKEGGLKNFLKSSSLGEQAHSGPTAVDRWVQKHGGPVPPTAYGGTAGGTLYLVTSASARLAPESRTRCPALRRRRRRRRSDRRFRRHANTAASPQPTEAAGPTSSEVKPGAVSLGSAARCAGARSTAGSRTRCRRSSACIRRRCGGSPWCRRP